MDSWTYFRSTSSGSSINSPGASGNGGGGGGGGLGNGNTCASMNGSYPVMGQFGGGQYCPVSENLGLTPHYSPGWYQSSAADPRFASKWRLSIVLSCRILFFFVWSRYRFTCSTRTPRSPNIPFIIPQEKLPACLPPPTSIISCLHTDIRRVNAIYKRVVAY